MEIEFKTTNFYWFFSDTVASANTLPFKCSILSGIYNRGKNELIPINCRMRAITTTNILITITNFNAL